MLAPIRPEAPFAELWCALAGAGHSGQPSRRTSKPLASLGGRGHTKLIRHFVAFPASLSPPHAALGSKGCALACPAWHSRRPGAPSQRAGPPWPHPGAQ